MPVDYLQGGNLNERAVVWAEAHGIASPYLGAGFAELFDGHRFLRLH